MIFRDLYLSDLEYDALKERLEGTNTELSEALKELNINMEPHRALECIAALGYFGRCAICGLWGEVDSEEWCWECFADFEDDYEPI